MHTSAEYRGNTRHHPPLVLQQVVLSINNSLNIHHEWAIGKWMADVQDGTLTRSGALAISAMMALSLANSPGAESSFSHGTAADHTAIHHTPNHTHTPLSHPHPFRNDITMQHSVLRHALDGAQHLRCFLAFSPFSGHRRFRLSHQLVVKGYCTLRRKTGVAKSMMRRCVAKNDTRCLELP
jgi:hypothetical protein